MTKLQLSAFQLAVGYSIGVTVTLALVLQLPDLARAIDYMSPNQFFEREPGKPLYPAETLGRPAEKSNQSTFVARYEGFMNDNPASFERLEDYPLTFAWRSSYQDSVGNLELGFVNRENDDRGVASCTASVISEHYLLTAWHCIDPEGYDDWHLEHVEFQLGYLSKDRSEIRRFPVELTPTEGDRRLDYAVLEVNFNENLIGGAFEDDVPPSLEEAEPPNILPVKLVEYTPSLDDRLLIFHYPIREPLVVTSHACKVVSEYQDFNRYPAKINWSTYRHTDFGHVCDTLVGSSGGPVVDLDRDGVVGIHTDGLRDRHATERHPNRASRIDVIARYSAEKTSTKIIADLIQPRPFSAEQRIIMEQMVGAARLASYQNEHLTALKFAAAAFPDSSDLADFFPPEASEATQLLFDMMLKLKLMWRSSFAEDTTAPLTFSADGKKIYIAGKSFNIRELDARSAEVTGEFSGHEDEITSIVSSPNGRFLVSLSLDGTLRVWGVAPTADLLAIHVVRYEPRPTFRGAGIFTAIDISPDSSTIAAGAIDGFVWLIDAESGEVTKTIDAHRSVVSAITFVPDAAAGARDVPKVGFVSASEDNSVKYWEAKKGKLLLEYPSLGDSVTKLKFTPSPIGNHYKVAASSRNGRLFFFTLDGESQPDIQFERTGRAVNFAFVHHGNLFVAAAGTDDFTLQRSLDGHVEYHKNRNGGEITAIVSGIASNVFAIGDESGAVELWSASGGSVTLNRANNSSVRALKFSPDGSVLVGVFDDGQIIAWDANWHTHRPAPPNHRALLSQARARLQEFGEETINSTECEELNVRC